MVENDAKRAAAEAAVAEVESGMLIGLGTGSTAAFAITALGRRIAQGLRVSAVATSLATEVSARAAGIPLLPFEDCAAVDLAIDGADQIDPQYRAIKGGGGALLREKIVAASATRMICIVDPTKQVAALDRALPIEVLPFARGFVARAVRALGGDPVLRPSREGSGPARSDQGNFLYDCHFGRIANPEELAARLDAVPGLLGHGLFLTEIDALFVGKPHGVMRHERDLDL